VTLVLLVLAVVAGPFVARGTPGAVLPVLVGVVLLFAGWQIYVLFGLSIRGIVARGSLFGEQVVRGRGTNYKAIYQFEIEGQQHTSSANYPYQRLIRSEVLVLFDPKRPKGGYILPRIFG
jgi:hypothetical protein